MSSMKNLTEIKFTDNENKGRVKFNSEHPTVHFILVNTDNSTKTALIGDKITVQYGYIENA